MGPDTGPLYLGLDLSTQQLKGTFLSRPLDDAS